MVISAPAFGGGIIEYGAGVVSAGGDLGGGASGAEVYGGEIVAHFVGSVTAFIGVALPELPVKAGAPAFGGGVIEYGAGVVSADGDLGGGASGAEVYGGEVVAHFVGSVTAANGVAVAELPLTALSPAFGGGVIEYGTGVAISGNDLGGGVSGAEVN